MQFLDFRIEVHNVVLNCGDLSSDFHLLPIGFIDLFFGVL